MSTIASGNTTTTAFTVTGDTTGNLVFTTGGANTTALTITNAQAATFAGTLTTASQGIASASLPAGSVLQVVNANTITNVSTSSTSYSDTTLTATITPKFATSKILVMVTQGGIFRSTASATLSIMIKTLRNSTSIVDYTYQMYSSSAFQFKYSSLSFNYLDSPATTSATTYKTQIASSTSGQTVSVQQDSDLSTIVLMEIAT